ncbi:hypothetical protein B0H10DRAFT_2187296 [Mycena sp. CBHHK59/15]|nr:hypothetical protein B0H10DRAFT_2187296 [Mycena sp. CBHHK59/15]
MHFRCGEVHPNFCYYHAVTLHGPKFPTCKRWRDVACGVPYLWSSLKVIASPTASEPSVEVLETWMHLSGSHPLSLSLVCRRRPETVQDDGASSRVGVSKVLEIFLLNIYRWRDISFDFSQQAPPVKYTPHLTAQGAPQLERLEMHPFSWSSLLGVFEIPWLVSALASAPLLRRFSGYRGNFPHALINTIPWKQLTHVRLESRLSEAVCLFILQSAPNLVECHMLDIRHGIFEHFLSYDPLLAPILPHLAKFSLATQVGFDKLFRLMVTPQLQTLEIATRSSLMRWDHPQFMAFLKRSLCSITTLIIRDLFISRLTPAEVYELLAHISDSLTHLAITSDIPGTPVGIQNSLLRGLAYHPTGRVLCPQLERISLQIGVSATDGELGRMIESRWLGHRQSPSRIVRLQYIDILCSTDTHSNDIRTLNALLKQGLEGQVRLQNS